MTKRGNFPPPLDKNNSLDNKLIAEEWERLAQDSEQRYNYGNAYYQWYASALASEKDDEERKKRIKKAIFCLSKWRGD